MRMGAASHPHMRERAHGGKLAFRTRSSRPSLSRVPIEAGLLWYLGLSSPIGYPRRTMTRSSWLAASLLAASVAFGCRTEVPPNTHTTNGPVPLATPSGALPAEPAEVAGPTIAGESTTTPGNTTTAPPTVNPVGPIATTTPVASPSANPTPSPPAAGEAEPHVPPGLPPLPEEPRSASRFCKQDSDCDLLPDDCVHCPPCQPVWRTAANHAAVQRATSRQRNCAPKACPRCFLPGGRPTGYVGNRAVCDEGQCSVRW